MNKITLGIVAALFSASASADYKFIDLHSSAACCSVALGINNLNQVVGRQSEKLELTNQSSLVPVLWNGETGSTTLLATPQNRVNGYASDINEAGQIVVASYDFSLKFTTTVTDGVTSNPLPGNGLYPLFLTEYHRPLELNNSGQVLASDYFNFKFTPKDTLWDSDGTPQVLDNFVNGFNDKGQMVGHISVNGESHAALFENGNTIDLGKGFVWATKATAIDINNSGQIIASAFGATTGQRSFLIDDGIIRSLKSSGERSEALALNEHGIVVGYQYTNVPTNHPDFEWLQTEAVIWDGNNQFKLNDFMDQDSKEAGWVLVTANDINDNGWVVGEAFNTFTRERHAYALSTDEMLSPIPEPSTYLMLLAGLGLLGFVAKRNCKTVA